LEQKIDGKTNIFVSVKLIYLFSSTKSFIWYLFQPLISLESSQSERHELKLKLSDRSNSNF